MTWRIGEGAQTAPPRRGAALCGLTLIGALGCGAADDAAVGPGACAAPGPVSAPITRCALEPGALTSSAEPGSAPLRVGLFLATSGDEPSRRWSQEEASDVARDGLEEAGGILAACGIHLQVQAAEVAAVPEELLAVEGNAPGSWGGAAPPGEADADLFNYQQEDRLSEEPRALLPHGRSLLDDGAIAIWVVDEIVYHHAQQATVAGGLSYPPIVYHQPEDFPHRNAVLVASGYSGPGSLPSRLNGRTLAHELGHMLLDSGQHGGEADNLMVSGSAVTEEQCTRMRLELDRLYGIEPPVDPLAGG